MSDGYPERGQMWRMGPTHSKKLPAEKDGGWPREVELMGVHSGIGIVRARPAGKSSVVVIPITILKRHYRKA